MHGVKWPARCPCAQYGPHHSCRPPAAAAGGAHTSAGASASRLRRAVGGNDRGSRGGRGGGNTARQVAIDGRRGRGARARGCAVGGLAQHQAPAVQVDIAPACGSGWLSGMGWWNGMAWGRGQRWQQIARWQKGSSCTTKGSQVTSSVLTGCYWVPHRRWSGSTGPGYHLSPRLQQEDRQGGCR